MVQKLSVVSNQQAQNKGPVVFDETNFKCYERLILASFFNKQTEEQVTQGTLCRAMPQPMLQ
jgi:hypothetical protein